MREWWKIKLLRHLYWTTGKLKARFFLKSTLRYIPGWQELIYVVFSPAGFMMSHGYWSRNLPGHFKLWPPSWTDWHTRPWSFACSDPIPGKMNWDYIKLFYCEFQNYKVMTMSVIDGQPKEPASPSYKATKDIERTFPISNI